MCHMDFRKYEEDVLKKGKKAAQRFSIFSLKRWFFVRSEYFSIRSENSIIFQFRKVDIISTLHFPRHRPRSFINFQRIIL